jgi:hypothetical protein
MPRDEKNPMDKQRYEAKLAALQSAIDEGDVFARVRETLKPPIVRR